MTDPPDTYADPRGAQSQRTARISLLVAAALFVVSFVFQTLASVQRWVVFEATLGDLDPSSESDQFDYFLPDYEWEPIEHTAQLLGVGLLVQAAGFAALAVGMTLIPRGPKRNGHDRSPTMPGMEKVMAVLVFAGFAAHGLFNVVAGTNARAPQLGALDFVFGPLLFLSLISLLALSALWATRMPVARAICLLLVGSTVLGYVLSSMLITPVFTGMSHDTARWTEFTVATTTLAAAILAVEGARELPRSKIDGDQSA